MAQLRSPVVPADAAPPGAGAVGGPAMRSPDQLLLPGIAPRWSETDEGREWIRMMQRYGIARVLKRAHQIRPAIISRLMRRAA